MKKLIACASALFVLSACAEEAVDEAPVEEVAEAGDTMEDYLGAWDVLYPDGSTGVTTNNADGSYTATMPDGSAASGLWSFGPDQSCWQASGEEEARCYTVSEPAPDGARTLTDADGNGLIVTPVADEETAAE